MLSCCGLVPIFSSLMPRNIPKTMTQSCHTYLDYVKTAQKVFEGCGMDGDGGLPVSKLMEKLSSYVPADRSADLQSLLDPDQLNPTVSAHEFAGALEKYGEQQHSKLDFDESINLRNGSTPIDSDSGISSDMGYQILEELQSELRDKRTIERRLRLTLDAAERAHEDALAVVTAERDSLRAHLQLMREENSTLSRLRVECEESVERLAAVEAARDTCRRELDAARKKLRTSEDALDTLQTERATLESLLAKSKEECHRINDMYAARQATLLEENETYKSSYADLNTRYQEQEEFLQQTLKEKVLLEMEMADVLNRSTRELGRPLERSFDVSCTDQQILRALDSLNLDSPRRDEDISLDELYISNSKIERGRPSLFDELLRVDSFHRFLPDDTKDKQDEKADRGNEKDDVNDEDNDRCATDKQRDNSIVDTKDMSIKEIICIATQTENDSCIFGNSMEGTNNNENDIDEQFNEFQRVDISTEFLQEEECLDCALKNARVTELECNISRSEKTINEMHNELTHYEQNLTVLQCNFDSMEEKNKRNQCVIEMLRKKIECLESTLKCQTSIENTCGFSCMETQTCDSTASVATQADGSCVECDKRSTITAPTRISRVRNFLWVALKGVLQLLAILCLCGAFLFLYNVSHYNYTSRRCVRGGSVVPWQWIGVADLLDLLFRIEYVGEIPV